jgi:hypothetical protein
MAAATTSKRLLVGSSRRLGLTAAHHFLVTIYLFNKDTARWARLYIYRKHQTITKRRWRSRNWRSRNWRSRRGCC